MQHSGITVSRTSIQIWLGDAGASGNPYPGLTNCPLTAQAARIACPGRPLVSSLTPGRCVTDTFHKPGFKMHARILHHLFLVAASDVIKVRPSSRVSGSSSDADTKSQAYSMSAQCRKGCLTLLSWWHCLIPPCIVAQSSCMTHRHE